MTQFDIIFRFTSLADALADPVVQAYRNNDNSSFRDDIALSQIDVWRASQDDPDGSHNFLAGRFIQISLPRLVAVLRDSPNVQLVIDRDKASARQPGAIIRSTVGAAILQDLRWSPVFMGCDYPWGNWT